MFPTPDWSPADGYICWRLKFPRAVEIEALLSDAIAPLLEEKNWRLGSTLSPLEISSMMGEMLLGTQDDDCMIGEIVAHIRKEVPDNLIPCDGRTVPVADWPMLADAVSPVFITPSGDDILIPDLRQRVLLGRGAFVVGQPNRTEGDMGGEYEVQLSQLEMPSHRHAVAGAVTAVELVNAGAPLPGAQAAPVFSDPAGGDQPHENMMPFFVCVYHIVGA